MVQVWAKDAAMAKLLTHPITKTGFIDPAKSANWPDDSFTHRRIRDGDVTTTDPGAESRARHVEQHPHPNPKKQQRDDSNHA